MTTKDCVLKMSRMEASDAPVECRVEMEIGAPPQVVWDVLTRSEEWPQ